MIVVGYDDLYHDPIYAAAPGNLCPKCGDILTELPSGPHMCGWCDILVATEDDRQQEGD